MSVTLASAEKNQYSLTIDAKYASPYLVNFAPLPDGALPDNWVGTSGAIASGKLIITPITDAELVTNGDMEIGSPPTGWLQSNATLTSVADEHTGGAGTKSLNIANSGAAAGFAYQTFAMTENEWYLFSGWIKSGTDNLSLALYGGDYALIGISTGTWANKIQTVERVGHTGVFMAVQVATAGRYGRADAISVKHIVKSSLLTYLNISKPSTGKVYANWNGVAGTSIQFGVVGWWDKVSALQNCLVARHNGSKATLIKYVGATKTILIDAAVTYSAGATIEIRRTDLNTFQLWYNGAKVGADQTISDAAIINNGYFGLLSSSGTAQCLSFGLGLF